VTYVNHIAKETLAEFLKFAANLNISAAGIGPKPLDVQVNLRYEIDSVTQGGSLQIVVNRPLVLPFLVGQPVGGWLLTLTYRGQVSDQTGPDGIHTLVARGREVIDQAFEDITLEDIQRSDWGKIVE
jgi:hypothetical protein